MERRIEVAGLVAGLATKRLSDLVDLAGCYSTVATTLNIGKVIIVKGVLWIGMRPG
jgi:hypothetical protein